MKDEAWMIELESEPLWWTGTTFDIRETSAWTSDPNNGIRFQNIVSAGVVASALRRELPKEEQGWRRNKVKCTAHEWPGDEPGVHELTPRETHPAKADIAP